MHNHHPWNPNIASVVDRWLLFNRSFKKYNFKLGAVDQGWATLYRSRATLETKSSMGASISTIWTYLN